MNQILPISARKATTFGLTVARFSNWPAIALAKSGLHDELDLLLFRDGFRLKAMPPLNKTWGEVFEPAIADARPEFLHALKSAGFNVREKTRFDECYIFASLFPRQP